MGFMKEFFRNRVPVNVLAGGHILTDAEEAKGLVQRCAFMKGRKSGEMEISTMFGRKFFQFSRIEWEESARRSAGKAAGGAVIGTVLAGPLGGIAGAAVGAKKKDTSKAYVYLIDDEGVEHEVHVQCNKEEYMKIARIAY